MDFFYFLSLLLISIPQLCSGQLNKMNLRQIIALIKSDCGQVCDTTIEGTPGKYYEEIKKDFECDDLLTNPILEWSEPDLKEPRRLEDLPAEVVNEYTYQGRVETMSVYINDARGGETEVEWPEEYVDSLVKHFKKGEYATAYSIEDCKNIQR